MAKSKKEQQNNIVLDAENRTDGLAALVAKKLNKKFDGGNQLVYFLGEPECSPTDIPGWVSSGATLMDIAVANQVNGGFPIGKIVELQGLSSSGKSLVGAHVLASMQKQGGIAVFIDTENSASREFLNVIGVNLEDLIYISPPPELNTVEDIYQMIEDTIIMVRENDKNTPMVILLDSLSAASTRLEMESAADGKKDGFKKDGWSTAKALVNSKAMRKLPPLFAREKVLFVVTNQLKHKMDAVWGDQYTTPGGLAIGYHSHIRIRLQQAATIKDANGMVTGNYIKAKVLKNKVAPPFKEVAFPLYYESGIHDDLSLFYFLKDNNMMQASGAWYTLKAPCLQNKDGESQEQIKFQAKSWCDILDDNPGLREYVIQIISDKLHTTYRKRTKEDVAQDNIVDELQPDD